MRIVRLVMLCVVALAPAGYAWALPEDRAVTLDLRDADLRQAVETLMRAADQSYAFTDEVSGRVTARLTDVPFGQALRVILGASGFEAVEEEGILLIRRKPQAPRVTPAVAAPAPAAPMPSPVTAAPPQAPAAALPSAGPSPRAPAPPAGNLAYRGAQAMPFVVVQPVPYYVPQAYYYPAPARAMPVNPATIGRSLLSPPGVGFTLPSSAFAAGQGLAAFGGFGF